MASYIFVACQTYGTKFSDVPSHCFVDSSQRFEPNLFESTPRLESGLESEIRVSDLNSGLES